MIEHASEIGQRFAVDDKAQYYDGYKKVRNRFRKYDSLGLVSDILEYLNAPVKDNREIMSRHPWLCLLVVKWILIDDSFFDQRRRLPTRNDTMGVLNMAFEVQKFARMPSEYESIELWLRTTIYQQYTFQRNPTFFGIYRQWMLFCNLDPNSWIKSTFRTTFGFSIETALVLSIAITTNYAESDHNFIRKRDFFPLCSELPEDEIDSFLNAISGTIPDLRDELIRGDEGRIPVELSAPPSQYLRVPYVRYRDRLYHFHRNLVYEKLDNIVYSMMRAIDGGRFMNYFGRIFESYVKSSLTRLNCKFITEEDIKAQLSQSASAIDFIIEESDSNIFLDAKAVEMSSRGLTAHRAQDIRSVIKTSALKAIEQANLAKSAIETGRVKGVGIGKEAYLLVVTYKEMFLLNGSVFSQRIGQSGLQRLYQKIGCEHPIPNDNIYFITIEQFDVLSALVLERRTTFAEALRRAREADSEVATRKFDFFMHLSGYDGRKNAPWLEEQFKEIIAFACKGKYATEIT